MNKFIVTYDEGDHEPLSEGFIITLQKTYTLKVVTDLYEEAKKSFPNLEPHEIVFGPIYKSDWCQGCLFARIQLPPRSTAKGWKNVDKIPNTIP